MISLSNRIDYYLSVWEVPEPILQGQGLSPEAILAMRTKAEQIRSIKDHLLVPICRIFIDVCVITDPTAPVYIPTEAEIETIQPNLRQLLEHHKAIHAQTYRERTLECLYTSYQKTIASAPIHKPEITFEETQSLSQWRTTHVKSTGPSSSKEPVPLDAPTPTEPAPTLPIPHERSKTCMMEMAESSKEMRQALEHLVEGSKMSPETNTKRVTKWAEKIRQVNRHLHRLECTAENRQIPSLVHVIDQLLTKIEAMTQEKRMLGLTHLFLW